MVMDALLLRRIEWNCSSVMRRLDGKTMFDVSQDVRLKESVIRSLSGIGGAAWNLSLEFKAKHREIDWKSLAAFADISSKTDVSDIWVAASMTLPELKKQLDGMR